MKELPIPQNADLSQVPKGETPYLRQAGNTQITNLLGDHVKLLGVVRACQGFASKKFDHYVVLSCSAHVWKFIFEESDTTMQKDIIEDLLVAGYTVSIQRSKKTVPHLEY